MLDDDYSWIGKMKWKKYLHFWELELILSLVSFLSYLCNCDGKLPKLCPPQYLSMLHNSNHSLPRKLVIRQLFYLFSCCWSLLSLLIWCFTHWMGRDLKLPHDYCKKLQHQFRKLQELFTISPRFIFLSLVNNTQICLNLEHQV